MIFLAWLSGSLYLIARGIVLLAKGLAVMLFYGVLLFGWACVMGVLIPIRIAEAVSRSRQHSA